uniref:Uncharacterized protein n=1 Tax=Myoviridae sp. ctj3P51 TaxID=2826687 RepID=A0A8S5NPZ9_9CAUD|nr:MAG TPA: hypothetical protein [Myoviridae sp. ctj3P51]
MASRTLLSKSQINNLLNMSPDLHYSVFILRVDLFCNIQVLLCSFGCCLLAFKCQELASPNAIMPSRIRIVSVLNFIHHIILRIRSYNNIIPWITETGEPTIWLHRSKTEEL